MTVGFLALLVLLGHLAAKAFLEKLDPLGNVASLVCLGPRANLVNEVYQGMFLPSLDLLGLRVNVEMMETMECQDYQGSLGKKVKLDWREIQACLGAMVKMGNEVPRVILVNQDPKVNQAGKDRMV